MGQDMIMLIGMLVVAFITILILSAVVIVYRLKYGGLITRHLKFTNGNNDEIREIRASIQRIEARLEALETLTMEREREEKFGMKM